MDHDPNQESNAGDPSAAGPSEPVRSRWTPKPEQIQILENIFNSGTVNPTKDETSKIRKILEQYGSVADANVFYWFQNRRSRSRRRQRQMQAAAAAAAGAAAAACGQGVSCPGAVLFEPTSSSSSPSNSSGSGFLSYSSSSVTSSSSPGFVAEGHSSYGEDLFSLSGKMAGYHDSGQNPHMYSSDASQLQYQQPGTITVFINGNPCEVPRGAFDMRAMFGQDVVLVHSSGELLPANEYGYLLQGLQMGESYFLVSRPT